MSDLVPVRRALLSVSDKTGLAEFARALHGEFKIELISTGGTAKFLRERGLPVIDVSQLTGFPEMMDGRIKTLHPLIHGGLLSLRDNPEHVEAMQKHGIRPIDLLCVNLYPFEKTVARPDASFDDAIENIDIGGPAMIRSAAKNHLFVLVVTSPDRYEKVLGDLREHNGASCGKHRLKQAQRAFAYTAAYDAAIAKYLRERVEGSGFRVHEGMPGQIEFRLKKKMELRYGENPHQQAALYLLNPEPQTLNPSVAFAKQLHGKELSYINLLDADAAMDCVKEFDRPAAVIVKHATPCGAAIAEDLPRAFLRAFECDPLAAFGGIVALNRRVDAPTAEAITSIDKLLEVIVAPGFDEEALDLVRERWKNVRLLDCGVGVPSTLRGQDAHATCEIRTIAGGFLVQEPDLLGIDQSTWRVVSSREPTARELLDLQFAWLICKHVKSNAIVISKDEAAMGIGGGQVDRVGAARVAIEKAGQRARGAVAASDAFFPFPDGPELLLRAGVNSIIQPGGSLRDQESIDAVNHAGGAMIFTGQRHFKH